MVRKARRLLGVSAFYLLLSALLFGCSGQQQTEEGVEVSEQGEQGAEGANQGADGQQQGDNVAEGQNEGDAAATEGSEGGTEEAAAPPAQGTENDLQEIIQEMNGQPASNGAQPAPLAQNAGAPLPTQGVPEAPAAAAAPTGASGPAPQGSSSIPFQPGGSPAGQGLPELGSKMAYIVEKGDTLGKISQKIYGNPGRWKELAELSGIANPSRIFPGDLVYYTLEEGAVTFAQAYESTARSEETVQPGDTLATIAKRVYGSTTGWRALWRQNDKIDNPDIVPPGTTVYYLPQGSAVAALEKINNQSVLSKNSEQFVTSSRNANNHKFHIKTVNSNGIHTFSTNSHYNKTSNLDTVTSDLNHDFQSDNIQLI